MATSTPAVINPRARLAIIAATSASTAAVAPTVCAALSLSRPRGRGRSGWATRSISTSWMSFTVLANAASAIAATIAATTRVSPSRPPAHQAPTATPAAAMRAFGHRTSDAIALGAVTVQVALVERLVLRDDIIPGEPLSRVRRTRGAHPLPRLRVAEDAHRCLRHAVDVPDLAQRTRLVLLHDLDEAAGARADHRHA